MFDIRLSGGTADLEPMLEDMTGSSGPTLPPFHIEGVPDSVWLTDNDAANALLSRDYREPFVVPEVV